MSAVIIEGAVRVHHSPACDMEQYASYPRHYYLMDGSYPLSSAQRPEELVARAGAVIVAVPIVPYFANTPVFNYGDNKFRATPVGQAPWAGGTWSGRCGATLWVPDLDLTYRNTFATMQALGRNEHIQADPIARGENATIQAWWINGVAADKPSLDGFPVECQQRIDEHADLCAALDIAWDWRDYSPVAPTTHNSDTDREGICS